MLKNFPIFIIHIIDQQTFLSTAPPLVIILKAIVSVIKEIDLNYYFYNAYKISSRISSINIKQCLRLFSFLFFLFYF